MKTMLGVAIFVVIFMLTSCNKGDDKNGSYPAANGNNGYTNTMNVNSGNGYTNTIGNDDDDLTPTLPPEDQCSDRPFIEIVSTIKEAGLDPEVLAQLENPEGLEDGLVLKNTQAGKIVSIYNNKDCLGSGPGDELLARIDSAGDGTTYVFMEILDGTRPYGILEHVDPTTEPPTYCCSFSEFPEKQPHIDN